MPIKALLILGIIGIGSDGVAGDILPLRHWKLEDLSKFDHPLYPPPEIPEIELPEDDGESYIHAFSYPKGLSVASFTQSIQNGSHFQSTRYSGTHRGASSSRSTKTTSTKSSSSTRTSRGSSSKSSGGRGGRR